MRLEAEQREAVEALDESFRQKVYDEIIARTTFEEETTERLELENREALREKLARAEEWSPGFRRNLHVECFQCNTCVDPKFSCRKPGIGYVITCLLCSLNGISAVYHGELS